ncbi:Acetyltransferase (GNAT) domain-containing protein [Ruminococcus sp. YRD2003]|uniref:GNAT family N-acetyltransferase n=1 Tax=Ruminococcus sp. YRD2003 TaxID=1452313 RepID=UPI0008B174B6|nr:Acetyltransferase (GNAT) domain-containing protein [Ruminococcus flavefaciens]
MDIITAAPSDLETVFDIAQSTIRAIYPHYYPAGAVDFFLAHHSREHISADIEAGRVSLAVSDGKAVGTVTVADDSINRLFVLPDEQGKGFGGKLLRFAEAEIAESYGTARLDSSLPAKQIYLRKGYMVIDSRMIEANGDFLCYDIMIKRVEANGD